MDDQRHGDQQAFSKLKAKGEHHLQPKLYRKRKKRKQEAQDGKATLHRHGSAKDEDEEEGVLPRIAIDYCWYV